MATETTFTLKQLPLPAKLVVTVFLLATGMGYFSALVQLHMQHSAQNGNPLPGPDDVIAIFAGLEKPDPAKAQEPVSKLEVLVMGPVKGTFNGTGTMAPAFFEKSEGDYRARIKDEEDAKKVTAEREGERQAVKAWIRLAEPERKAAYETDTLAKADAFKDISPEFTDKGQVKIKQLLDERCARCHSKNGSGDGSQFPLEKYDQFLKYLTLPIVEKPDAAGYVRSRKQMSVEKLTTSTHAHLLSFGMLFGLTGLAFAFTSYPKLVRVIVAPIVMMAQVADVSCWWLARMDGGIPLFALAIMGTGAVAGLGLSIHIFGSIFDMFHRTGRRVLILLLLIAAGGFGVLYTKGIEPALKAEKMNAKGP